MKHTPILTHIIALCLPIAAIAQERVTIDGILSDGTPPPPPPPKVIHDFKVLSTEEIPLEQRKMILHRVEDPGFPDPTPPVPIVTPMDPATQAAFRQSLEERREAQDKTTHLFLSATIVDHRATLLRWWSDGKEFQAWSNVDFNFLTGFASFSKGDRHFVTFMGVGDVDSGSLRHDTLFSIPADLPTGLPHFRMVDGAGTGTEEYEAVAALHELYQNEGERLREAYALREKRREEAEAELRANPPVPKDIVLNFWKVEPPKAATKIQAPKQGKIEAEGGAAQ